VSRGMVPNTFHVHLSSLPPLAASSAAVLIAVVAAGCAGRRARRISPVKAWPETTVEPAPLRSVRDVGGLRTGAIMTPAG
jgi:hypothetical protein